MARHAVISKVEHTAHNHAPLCMQTVAHMVELMMWCMMRHMVAHTAHNHVTLAHFAKSKY